jgi:hypothetical protein
MVLLIKKSGKTFPDPRTLKTFLTAAKKERNTKVLRAKDVRRGLN